MLLQNYFAWMYSQRYYNNVYKFATTIKDLSGNTCTVNHGHNYGSETQINQGHNLFSLRFGHSNTPTVSSQYAMNDDITNYNYVSINSQNLTVNNNLDSIEYVFIANLVNSTSNPQVIKEVGIVKILFGKDGNIAYDSLIAHEVLSEPITIPANGAKTVKYIWTIS